MENPATARKSFEEPAVDIAKAIDVPSIKLITDADYSKYIEVLGMLPAAMKGQYDKIIEMQKVHVLRADGDVVGSIILSTAGDSVTVDNLVVAPSAQGRGFGRGLMKYAEDKARGQGLAAVTLFANEKIDDNIDWYTRIGFIETERKTVDGFNRVHFRKNLI
jgi:N-acetylglutamate synthase-like GNAT family acetyltransferase